MKTERELFQEHYKTSRDYKFYVKHEMTEKQIFEFNNGKYSVDCVNDGWKIWQASDNREGYKLVPVEPNEAMLEALEVGFKPDYEGGSYDSYEGYKAMMGEVE